VTPLVLDRAKVAGSPPALDGDAIHVWTIALDDTSAAGRSRRPASKQPARGFTGASIVST
jgi:hypothetical protein